MITRVSTRQTIRPLHRYVTEGRDFTILGGTGFGLDIDSERREDIALDVMEHDGADSRRIQKPFLHIILSWHPDQSPDHDEQRDAARGILSALDMPNARSIIYRHDDKPHPHVHMVGSRFDPEAGRFYDVHQSINKGIRWSKEWEHEHGIPDSRRKDHGLDPQVGDDYWKQLDDWGKRGPDLSRAKDIRKLFDAHRGPLSASETFRRMMHRHAPRSGNEREDRTLATTVGTRAREQEQGLGM